MEYTYLGLANYFDVHNTTYKDFLIKYTSVDVYNPELIPITQQAIKEYNSYTISFWFGLFLDRLDVFHEIKGFREVDNWEAFNCKSAISDNKVIVIVPFEPKRCVTVSVGCAFYGSMLACLTRNFRPIIQNIDVNGFEKEVELITFKTENGYAVVLDIDMCTASITTGIVGQNNEQAFISRKTAKNLIPSHNIINNKVAKTSDLERDILIQDIVNNKISFQ